GLRCLGGTGVPWPAARAAAGGGRAAPRRTPRRLTPARRGTATALDAPRFRPFAAAPRMDGFARRPARRRRFERARPLTAILSPELAAADPRRVAITSAWQRDEAEHVRELLAEL